jgi:putative redox protein
VLKALKALDGEFAVVIESGAHRLLADADAGAGGEDLGPAPHAYFDAALAACTAITVLMVARRKEIPLDDVQVEITHEEDAEHYRMRRQLRLIGTLSEEQRSYLLGIANKCPIHKLLHKQITVETSLEAPPT